MTKLCFPEKVLDQHLVALGKTGSGKSSALRHIVEHLLDRNKRLCIVDPKGDWWGLKSSADGRSAGYPVIAFGDFKEPKATDVPLNSQSGRHVAELITSGNRPCIIGMRGWMPGQMTDFWLDFAPALFNGNEGELYVVIDEVHNFAPKGKILDPKAGKVIHWTNRMLSEGRGIGLTFLIASQRPQKVHNDTLTCCETLLGMRVVHKSDRDAIEDWIEGCGDGKHGSEVIDSLANMARGEAWVWSPEIGFGPERIKFPMFTTFDSFAPPQLQKKVTQAGWSTVDLDAVKQKLAAVIKEAEENDPAKLKRRIAELQKELRTGEVSQPQVATIAKPDHAAVQRAVAKALKDRDRQWADVAKSYLRNLKLARHAGITAAYETMDAVAFAAPQDAAPIPVEMVPPRLTPAPRPEARRPQARASVAAADGELTGPERRIVNAIAWLNNIGVAEPEQTAVAFLAGYVVTGGGFCNPRGALNTKGLVQYRGDRIVLTTSGAALAEVPDAPLDSRELQRMVLSRLPGPEAKILTALIRQYPDSMSNEDCAAAAGYEPEGGGYCNPRGRLRSLGLIDYPEKGKVVARSLLFLEND